MPVALTVLAGVVSWCVGHRDSTRGTDWIGVIVMAGGVVYLALAHRHPAYLILLAYVPLGYLALRGGSQLRDRNAEARRWSDRTSA